MRRLIRKELKAASRRLQGKSLSEHDVHEARKSLKKIRALLRIVRKALGRHFQTEDHRLKIAARRLGELRDADVMRHTFAGLHTEALARSVEITSGTPEFHAWRRRVQEHWYHVRLFESIESGARSRARRLKQLERDLGVEHDLGHLSELLADHPGRFGGAVPTTIAQGCIQRRQRTLRGRALIQGRRLFALRPHEFRTTVRHWWQAKRRAER